MHPLHVYLIDYTEKGDYVTKRINIVANDGYEAILLLKAHCPDASKVTGVAQSTPVDIGRTEP